MLRGLCGAESGFMQKGLMMMMMKVMAIMGSGRGIKIPREQPKENKDFISYLKDHLKDKVKDVKVSKRLTTSASCLVADENDMDMHLKKLMAANNQTISDEKRILEININHSLVSKVMSLDKNSKDKFSEILYDHAKLMEGENLDDPKKYTNLIAELVSL